MTYDDRPECIAFATVVQNQGFMYKTATSPPKEVKNSAMADITESSSSDGSPASVLPSGDVTLDKDVDNKTLKQSLYDLKLRIYYMEQKNKYKEEDDGGGDIYQKYVDLQTELEKLKKNLDEKDELLLKAQKVTLYLRQEKEKTLYEFQEKEKVYKESIQQLEKEVEEMKLSDPKFGLHNSAVFMFGGDSADCGDSASSCISSLSKAQHRRISELESQLNQLNMELESVKANNDQLEQTVFNLQRKINLSNKEVTELNRELSNLHKERDIYVENCSKRDEILDRMEKQKLELSEKLSKAEQENESLRSTLTSNAEQNASSRNDKGTAVIIQRLLIENKKVNGRLRKVKEDLLQFYEQCSACPHCVNEKKLKKAPILNLRPTTVAAADATMAVTAGTSEDEYCEKRSSGGGASESEKDENGEKYANTGESELQLLLRDKDELIEQLKDELKKRTFNLQELVNKELWDKNREIEKLNKMSEKRKKENDLLRKQLAGYGVGDGRTIVIGTSSCSYGYSYGKQPCSPRNYKIDEKENISCMSDDVKLLKEHLRSCLEEKKALLEKINALESKVAIGDEERRSQHSLVRNLRLECAKRKDHFEEAEKARKEAFNACALLTNRLEELACFLESLLAHDGGVGINANKRQLLKQAIEKSREISKSFSCTFGYATKLQCSSVDLSVPILPDCSEINLSFSGGDDDDDDDDENNLDDLNNNNDDDDLDEDDYDVVAGPRDQHYRSSHCVNQRERTSCKLVLDRALHQSYDYNGVAADKRTSRSADFTVSTEDSDFCDDTASGAISYVRHLNADNELVFSKTGVRKLTNSPRTNVNVNAIARDDVTDENNEDDNLVEQRCAVTGDGGGGGGGGVMQNSVTASSAIVSLDEAPPKVGDFDSESETWSEPDRNVSAARIGLTNSASKACVKRLRPAEQRFNSDSDVSSRRSVTKKYPDAADIKQLQRRIQHLENVNESLREELRYLRLPSQALSLDASTAADKKTDMEKLSEKTKLRNLLNKINLENYADTKKYRDTVEVVRKHLRELCKHMAKTNELDKFVSLKLKEVCEHFELSELCCSRLSQRLEEAKTRNDVLSELLEETQSKFERVMIDLRTTKLAYNSVILEHEQNIFRYKQSELTNEQLKQKLKSADELCRRLEEEGQQQHLQQQRSKKEERNAAAPATNATDDHDGDLLVDMLEKASKRIAQLELLVTTNDTACEELELCKRNVQQLGEANEKLLRGVEELDAYKAKIEEYENQLRRYRENCEKLESELFEKERMEKLCRERCAELEERMLEKNALERSLEVAGEELREARRKIENLERRVDELVAELRESELSAGAVRDRHACELNDERERNALLLRELRNNAERELAEKSDAVEQLRQLVDVYDQRSRKFENEIQLLRDMLKTCEDEKREFRVKIAHQMDEHETLKKQHEQKMKHLLGQIIAYRTEEESSLAAHRQLVTQIEQAQTKKHTWKNSIREWKRKYEELKKEKQEVEHRLMFRSDGSGRDHEDVAATGNLDGGHSAIVESNAIADTGAGTTADYEPMKFNVERDWLAREAELRYQVDVATLTTSHVILEWTRLANEKLRLQRELHRRDKPLYVHHLESNKCQLEKRVKELETANRELELRLKRLQNVKITRSDLDASSEEERDKGDRRSSRTASSAAEAEAETGKSFALSACFRNDVTAAAAATYSSCSLPTSPNRSKRTPSPFTTSVPNSPTRLQKDYFATAAGASIFDCENYADDDDDDDDDDGHRTKVTPARRRVSEENNATSPDLGIDSDHGRNSSSFEFDSGNGGETKIRCEIINLEEENKTLKRELGQTKKELEETLGKLTTLNKNKKRMEKAIFKQIFETKHILKRARVNLEDVATDKNVDDAAADTDANADAAV